MVDRGFAVAILLQQPLCQRERPPAHTALVHQLDPVILLDPELDRDRSLTAKPGLDRSPAVAGIVLSLPQPELGVVPTARSISGTAAGGAEGKLPFLDLLNIRLASEVCYIRPDFEKFFCGDLRPFCGVGRERRVGLRDCRGVCPLSRSPALPLITAP